MADSSSNNQNQQQPHMSMNFGQSTLINSNASMQGHNTVLVSTGILKEMEYFRPLLACYLAFSSAPESDLSVSVWSLITARDISSVVAMPNFTFNEIPYSLFRRSLREPLTVGLDMSNEFVAKLSYFMQARLNDVPTEILDLCYWLHTIYQSSTQQHITASNQETTAIYEYSVFCDVLTKLFEGKQSEALETLSIACTT